MMKSEDGTKDRQIRKEFNDFCRASMPYEEAKRTIAQAVKNDYSEAFCNKIVDGNRDDINSNPDDPLYISVKDNWMTNEYR